MEKIKRFYNQNRKWIFTVIVFLVFLFIILRLLDNWAKVSNEKEKQEKETENTLPKYNDVIIQSDKSVTSGEKLTEKEKNIDISIINDFIAFCKNGEIEKAYELLSDDCKNELYSDVETFKNRYCDEVFTNNNISTNVEKWSDNTYRVKIKENPLTTGVVEDTAIEDYITIIDQGETKISINSYLGKTNINKEKTINNISITVKEVDKYMDYEIYTFSVINKSNNKIILDSLARQRDTYLQDINDLKYPMYTQELQKAKLTFAEGEERTIKIKFYSKYTSTKKIEKIVFSRIILDYDDYLEFNDDEYYTDSVKIEIPI